MFHGIAEHEQFSNYDWPRANAALEFRTNKVSRPKQVLDSKLDLKISARIIAPEKNTGFDNLEEKILLIIFSYLSKEKFLSYARRVCRHWNNVARHPKLWKKLEFKAGKTDAVTTCNLLRKYPNLEKLSLKDIENPVTVIRQMCRCNRSLKCIEIRNCKAGQNEKIPETVLRNILYSCRNIESLDLNGTQFSATRFYHELANLPKLRKLNLNNNKYLLAKDLVTIGLNCRNLEDISITRAEDNSNSFQIADQDVVFFFKNLSESLKFVDFDTTGLSGSSFEAILSCPNLERLSLRHALFLSGTIFRKYVSKLRRLKQLRLTQACQLVSDDLASVSKEGVFDRLNLLDLSGCGRISDRGITSLIQRCKVILTYLNLKSCKSMKDLNYIIDNCTELRYLNIAHSFSPDPSDVKNLLLKIPKLRKLVIDDKILSRSDSISFQTCSPKLKLLCSMSEFCKDESLICLKEIGH